MPVATGGKKKESRMELAYSTLPGIISSYYAYFGLSSFIAPFFCTSG